MNKLIDAIEQLMNIKGYDWQKLFLASTHYIETLSLSDSDEIKEMLKYIHEHHFMDCPFWAILIAFRLLVAQNPNDEEIKYWALSDLGVFGNPELDKKIENWWNNK